MTTQHLKGKEWNYVRFFDSRWYEFGIDQNEVIDLHPSKKGVSTIYVSYELRRDGPPWPHEGTCAVKTGEAIVFNKNKGITGEFRCDYGTKRDKKGFLPETVEPKAKKLREVLPYLIDLLKQQRQQSDFYFAGVAYPPFPDAYRSKGSKVGTIYGQVSSSKVKEGSEYRILPFLITLARINRHDPRVHPSIELELKCLEVPQEARFTETTGDGFPITEWQRVHWERYILNWRNFLAEFAINEADLRFTDKPPWRADLTDKLAGKTVPGVVEISPRQDSKLEIEPTLDALVEALRK